VVNEICNAPNHAAKAILLHLTYSIRYGESLYYVELLHFCTKPPKKCTINHILT